MLRLGRSAQLVLLRESDALLLSDPHGCMYEIAAVPYTVQGNYSHESGISRVSVGQKILYGLMKRYERCRISARTQCYSVFTREQRWSGVPGGWE